MCQSLRYGARFCLLVFQSGALSVNVKSNRGGRKGFLEFSENAINKQLREENTMERRSSIKMVSRFLFTVCLLLLGTCFVLSTPLMSKAADTITIKAVTSFPKNATPNLGFPAFIKLVEQKSGGRLIIKYVGGPEVIKTFDQGEALRRGTIDMILFTPMAYLKSLAPAVQAKGLSHMTAWEERAAGVHDIWDQILQEKMNAKYLGTVQSGNQFAIYSNKKIEKLSDLKGLNIRSMPLYSPFLTKLGAKPIIIPPPDVYTALQRGVVDGFLFSEDAEIPDWGWEEVTKYKIMPHFFQIENATLMNLDKYNALPKDLQEILEMCVEIFEGQDSVRYLQLKEAGWKKMQAAGMTEIVLPPEDAAELVKVAYEATWETVLKDAPEWGPKLKELLDKPAK